MDADKPALVPLAATLQELGYKLLATAGTARRLREEGVDGVVETSLDGAGGEGLLHHMAAGTVALVINTTRPGKRRIDPHHLRRLVLTYNIPYCTTIEAAQALVAALGEMGPERSFSYEPLRGAGGVNPAPG